MNDTKTINIYDNGKTLSVAVYKIDENGNVDTYKATSSATLPIWASIDVMLSLGATERENLDEWLTPSEWVKMTSRLLNDLLSKEGA